MKKFGQRLGIAYQALDDLEDHRFDDRSETWNEEGAQRLTFVTEFGSEGAAGKVDQLWKGAMARLESLGAEGLEVAPLRRLLAAILKREAFRSTEQI